MNRDDLFKEIDGKDEKDDDLFKDINGNLNDGEDDLYNDINNSDDDDKDDYLDDFGSEDDEPFSLFNKVKEIQLTRKTILFVFFGLFVVAALIIGLITFIVIHNDKPPVAQIVHIESNNSNKAIAKYGDKITLSFKFDKKIKNTPVVYINGDKVNVEGSERSFYAEYYVIDQDYEESLVKFSIEEYKDSFGKSGEKIENTTDLSKVTILALFA